MPFLILHIECSVILSLFLSFVRSKLHIMAHKVPCNLSLLVSLTSSPPPITGTGTQDAVMQSCCRFLKTPCKGAFACPSISSESPSLLATPKTEFEWLSSEKSPLPCRRVGHFLFLKILLSVFLSSPLDSEFLESGTSVLLISLLLPLSMQPDVGMYLIKAS